MTSQASTRLERLADRLNQLCDYLGDRTLRLALRPAAGDAIATVAHYERLQHWLDVPDKLALAADIGAMVQGHELPLGDRLARNLASLACVYLCDRRAGTTTDARIGYGDVAVARIIDALAEFGYTQPAIVRVDGHSELGFETAEESTSLFRLTPQDPTCG